MLPAFSLATALAELARPGVLIDQARWEFLQQRVQFLPAVWQWGMIELRMGDRHRADLLCAVAEQPEARAGFKQLVLPPFAKDWAENAWTDIEPLWLEWDQAQVDKEPLLWWGVDPSILARKPPLSPAIQQKRVEDLMDRIQSQRPQALNQTLSKVMDALTGRGRLLAVCHLGPRKQQGWRLFVTLRRTSFKAFLQAAGMTSVSDAALYWWDAALMPMEWGYLQITLDPELGPALGIEAQQTGHGFTTRPSRQRWLQHMVAHQLCSAEAAEAILDWPGEQPCQDPTKYWLRSMHMKLSLLPDQEPFAKVYLGFTQLMAGASVL